MYYRLAHDNPGAVAWYCGLKLEMGVALTRRLLTLQMQSSKVPHKDQVVQMWRDSFGLDVEYDATFEQVLLDCGRVDDSWTTFEWSAGGLVHVHVALWIVGSPRIDKVILAGHANETAQELDIEMEDRIEMEQGAAADKLANFFDRVCTEWNIAKATQGGTEGKAGRRQLMGKKLEKQVPAPDGISEKALSAILGDFERAPAASEPDAGSKDEVPWYMGDLSAPFSESAPVQTSMASTTQARTDPEQAAGSKNIEHAEGFIDEAEAKVWDELDSILHGHGPDDEYDPQVCGPMSACWQEARHKQEARGAPASGRAQMRTLHEKKALARRAFVATLAEWVQMHDYHQPFPAGPPRKGQPCAQVDNEHSHQEKTSCGKLFPRKCIAPGAETIAEDPRRRDLYRLWLARNCNFFNNFVTL